MTPTGHWNRVDERTRNLPTREALEEELQAWERRWKHYHDKLADYCVTGGKINSSHHWVFGFIASKSKDNIKHRIENLKTLDSTIPQD